jgi:hypothetical protein
MTIYSLMGSIFQCCFSIISQPSPDSEYLVKLAYLSAKYVMKHFVKVNISMYNSECIFSLNSVLNINVLKNNIIT